MGRGGRGGVEEGWGDAFAITDAETGEVLGSIGIGLVDTEHWSERQQRTG